MSRVEFAKDEQGREKRIYLQSSLKTLGPVLALERDLTSIPDLEFQPLVDNKHLTNFHYGRPTDFYNELKFAGVNLVRDDFDQRFGEMLRISWLASQEEDVVAITKASNLNVERLENFGSDDKRILVLLLEKTEQLRRYRSRIVRPFMAFLAGLGIRDPEQFMVLSSNLQHQLDQNHNPHITLGTAAFIPTIPVRQMRLPLHPPSLVNVILR